MRIISALILLGVARLADAQQKAETVAELAPIMVSETFQLQLPRPESDHAVQTVEKAILQREAKEKARERSVLFDAKFWRYIPKFGLPDEKEFFVPNYSTVAYRNSEMQLRSSQRHSLITR